MKLYRNNLKNRDFGKEAPQNFNSERTTIAERQGVSENQNSEVKPTQPKTDSSGCFGIMPLRLSGLISIYPSVFSDDRGFFLESYRHSLYITCGIDVSFVQDNISFSKQGTIRALHFQSHPGQAKLISCLEGKIWDVAVDIRPHSPTFGQWEALELDSEKHNQLFIPVGFAHGYCVLSSTAKVFYKVSSIYDASQERSIRWNDPDIQIPWPISTPVLSDRDQRSPFFKEVFR